MSAKPVGSIGWVDMTVDGAPALRDFYRDVVGWGVTEIDMGGYADYAMTTPAGEAAVGICHGRGANAGLPAGWLIYILVADLDASLAAVAAGGGEVVTPVRNAGGSGRYAVIRDPAGSHAALFEAAEG